MATEKLNLTTRHNNENPQIKTIKTAMRSDSPDHTQHKNPQQMYLKLFTPLVPSVEKIVNLLHGFKPVY
jgi:hypothetical protein